MRRESIARASANSEQNWWWGGARRGGAGRGLAGWATLLSKPGAHRGGLPYLHKSGRIQFVLPRHTPNRTRMLRIPQASRRGGGHSQNERSDNTGSAGDDSICTVCVSVVMWNKFSTPQQYVKRKDRAGEVGERNVGITATSSTVTCYT